MVGGKGENDAAFRVAGLERRKKPPELHVEPPQHVEVLLRLAAVVVRDGVLRREGDAKKVWLGAAPQSEAGIPQHGQREVHRDLVDERALVDGREVALAVPGQVVVEAQAADGHLEKLEASRGRVAVRSGLARVRKKLPEAAEPGVERLRGRAVEALDDRGHGAREGRRRRIGRRGDEPTGPLVVPVDRVVRIPSREKDGPAVLARERDDARPGARRHETVTQRGHLQLGGARVIDGRAFFRGGIPRVGAVDHPQGAVLLRFEPAIRHDARDARRRSRAERGVARAGLGVQVVVARGALHIALVEQAPEPRDVPLAVLLESREAQPVDRDDDGQLRGLGRRGWPRRRVGPAGGEGNRGGEDEGEEQAETTADILHRILPEGTTGSFHVFVRTARRRPRVAPVRINPFPVPRAAGRRSSACPRSASGTRGRSPPARP